MWPCIVTMELLLIFRSQGIFTGPRFTLPEEISYEPFEHTATPPVVAILSHWLI